MIKVEFQKACLEAGIQLNEEQMNQFEKYINKYFILTFEGEIQLGTDLKQCVILAQAQDFQVSL